MAASYRISVLDKLIMSDVFKTLVGALSTIVIIIVSREFIRVLGKAVKGEVANDTITSIFILKMLSAVSSFLPAAFFMAVMMVLGRMYRDHEMAALSSAGIGVGKIFRAVFLLIIPLSIMASAMSFYVAPWAEATVEQMLHKDSQTVDMRGIVAGQFSEYKQGDLVFYVQDITKQKRLQGIFVQDRLNDQLSIIVAQEGEIRNSAGGRYLVLYDGERHQGKQGEVDFTVERFEQYALRLESVTRKLNLDKASVPTRELLHMASLANIAELQERLAIPLGIMILGALAIPLAYISPRGGMYGNLLLAFLIYFCYINLRRLNESWVMNAVFPPWISFTAIYLMMALVVIMMVVRLNGWLWLKLAWTKKGLL